VAAAIAKGRIERGDDGMIDAKAAIEAWPLKKDSRGGKRNGHDPDAGVHRRYWLARAPREETQQQMAALRLQVARHELAPLAAIEPALGATLSVARQNLQALPGRLAAKVGGTEEERRRILEVASEEIRRFLGDMAEGTTERRWQAAYTRLRKAWMAKHGR
jgi:hypothetical protein